MQKNSLNSELREIVVSWEKLRIHYNLIHLVAGILAIIVLAKTGSVPLGLLIVPAFIFAIFANICFCAGPLAEIYARVIFNTEDFSKLRKPLFLLGILLSLIPAVLVILFSASGPLIFKPSPAPLTEPEKA